MSQTDPVDAQALAANPQTDPAVLGQLAAQHPEVQALIAANPAAYPGLLEWIATHGTAEGQAVASQRLAAPAAPVAPAAAPVAPETSAPVVPAAPPSGSRTWVWVLVACAVVVALVGSGLAWFFVGRGSQDEAADGDSLAVLTQAVDEATFAAERAEDSIEVLRKALDELLDAEAALDASSAEATRLATARESAQIALVAAQEDLTEARETIDTARETLAQVEAKELSGEEMKAAVQQQVDALANTTDTLDSTTAELEDMTETVVGTTGKAPSTDAGEGDCVPPVPGAYACAGLGIPEDATALTIHDGNHGYSQATVQTPSRNIGCDVHMSDGSITRVECAVWSWPEEGAIPRDASCVGYEDMPGCGDPDTVMFDDYGDHHLASRSEGAAFTGSMGYPEGQVLQYGQVAYCGDYVFASSEDGLTVWNADTGYGALLNRTEFLPFGPR